MWLDIFHGTHTRHSMPGRGTMLHRTCLPRTGFTCGLQRVIQLLVQSGDPEDVFLMIHDDILPAHIFFWGFLFVSLVPIGKLRLTILGYVRAAPLMLDWPLRIDQHFDTLCTEIYVYTVDVYKYMCIKYITVYEYSTLLCIFYMYSWNLCTKKTRGI